MYPSYCSKYFGVDHSYCLANCYCNTTSLKLKKKKEKKKKHWLIWIMQWNPIDAILKYLHFMQGKYSPFHLRSYTLHGRNCKALLQLWIYDKIKRKQAQAQRSKAEKLRATQKILLPMMFKRQTSFKRSHILTFQSKKRVTYTPTQWRNQNLSSGKEFIYTTRTYIYYVNV